MPVEVCGFALPDEIARVAADSAWVGYREDDRLPPEVVEAVFGEAPERSWRFYSVGEMESETNSFKAESESSWFGDSPHDVDPHQTLLIGDLGYDRPFGLDFRGGLPAVRFMTIDARWVIVAESAAALVSALGIEVECS